MSVYDSRVFREGRGRWGEGWRGRAYWGLVEARGESLCLRMPLLYVCQSAIDVNRASRRGTAGPGPGSNRNRPRPGWSHQKYFPPRFDPRPGQMVQPPPGVALANVEPPESSTLKVGAVPRLNHVGKGHGTVVATMMCGRNGRTTEHPDTTAKTTCSMVATGTAWRWSGCTSARIGHHRRSA